MTSTQDLTSTSVWACLQVMRGIYYEGVLNLFSMGVTLAQLVKAYVGQTDVQRFEPHLGHNWLSCGVFLVKSRHFVLPLAQNTRPCVINSMFRVPLPLTK